MILTSCIKCKETLKTQNLKRHLNKCIGIRFCVICKTKLTYQEKYCSRNCQHIAESYKTQSKETIQKRINSIRNSHKIWPSQRKEVREKIGLKNSISQIGNKNACGKESKLRAWETRRKNDPNNLSSKKAAESRSKETYYKVWETRRKNGTDKVSKDIIEKIKNTKRKKFASGELKIWNKGLTKETDKRVAKYAKSESETFSKMLTHDFYKPSIGKNETKILNEIEQKEEIKIDRNFKVLRFRPDGYCHETNTIYEVYEPFHKSRIKNDLERQKIIEEKLNCKFVIIKDRWQ